MPDEVEGGSAGEDDKATEQAGTVAEKWNLEPLTRLLSARSESAAEAAWVDALPTLSERFVPDVWGCNFDVNVYGPGAHKNLMNTEIRSDFKTWLKETNISLDEYTQAVGPVQYVSTQIYLHSLFARALNNKGWRIRILGFPSLDIVACGLASHYQGTQNHNLMGEASARIRSRALEALSGEMRSVLDAWPSATSEHWEERGLIPEPVTRIGNLDISTFDEGHGARLRMVRNTTVKKELSTFFAIKGLTAEAFIDEGPVLLDELRQIAFELGKAGATK